MSTVFSAIYSSIPPWRVVWDEMISTSRSTDGATMSTEDESTSGDSTQSTASSERQDERLHLDPRSLSEAYLWSLDTHMNSNTKYSPEKMDIPTALISVVLRRKVTARLKIGPLQMSLDIGGDST